METRKTDDRKTKLLRYDLKIHQWFEIEAKRHYRSVNAEMEMALEHWIKTKESTE